MERITISVGPLDCVYNLHEFSMTQEMEKEITNIAFITRDN